MAKGLYIGVLELTNLCPAVDGANGFTVGGGGTMESSSTHTKYSTNALKLNAVEGNAEVYATSQTTIPLNPEHIYYARVEAYQEAAYGDVEIYFPIAEPHMFNLSVKSGRTWNIYSAVVNRTGFSAGNYSFRLDFNSMHNNYINASIWYDGWMIIDLTEAFGTGNEPTQEWCDENISYFVGTEALQVSNLSGKARKVTKGCIGVEDLARKIKKGYIGDENGIARLFYESEPGFSSCPFPITWTKITDYGSEYNASNDFGLWKLTVNYTDRQNQSNNIDKAFDNNDNTYWSAPYAPSSSEYRIQINCPVYIKPKHIYIKYYGLGWGDLYGYNIITKTWDIIYGSIPVSTVTKTLDTDLNVENYYSAFKLSFYRNSSSSTLRIYEFKITSGSYKLPS